MKEVTSKKIGTSFLVSFLLTFMLLIFGPSEIFFANVTEFGFVYGEFAGYMAGFALTAAGVFTLLTVFLPERIYKAVLSFVFTLSVGGYIQVMLLNKNLDLLGANPEGYRARPGQYAGNLMIWLVILIFILVLAFWKFDIWKKTVVYLSAFLLMIQAVAMVSLMVSAGDEAYHYPADNYHLSGKDQYVVSANKNVIVIILDRFSNQYMDSLLNAYPDAVDFLHDFTYYSNADCVYYGTFPSMLHLLTGKEVDMSCSINEWFEKNWNNEKTNKFYEMLSEQNFVTNVYTPDTHELCGLNSLELLQGKLSNVVNSSWEREIDQKLLLKTMVKMSAYRMFPDIAKGYFYKDVDGYSDIVKNKINHQNYDFYRDLKEKKLTVDSNSNYYIVQHLRGPHSCTTDARGNYKKNATMEETTKGCMVIVEEYLNQLKDLGVYDDATIIITADHGGYSEPQVIFFMKEAQEKHDVLSVNAAPVSHNEFLPTIVEAVGKDYTEYGKSVHDYKEGEERSRTLWRRGVDPDYPKVMCYTGDKYGTDNVYCGYTYTGDIRDLLEALDNEPSETVPMVDAFF